MQIHFTYAGIIFAYDKDLCGFATQDVLFGQKGCNVGLFAQF